MNSTTVAIRTTSSSKATSPWRESLAESSSSVTARPSSTRSSTEISHTSNAIASTSTAMVAARRMTVHFARPVTGVSGPVVARPVSTTCCLAREPDGKKPYLVYHRNMPQYQRLAEERIVTREELERGYFER